MTIRPIDRRGGARRAFRSVGMAVAAVAAIGGTFGATVANAEFGVQPGSYVADVSTLQAGAHPDATMSFTLNTTLFAPIPAIPFFTLPLPDGNGVRDLLVDLPPGLVGNPQAVPQCDSGSLTQQAAEDQLNCPAASIVGVAEVDLLMGFGVTSYTRPVFSIEPADDAPAAFAFDVSGFGVTRFDTAVASDGDYHVRVNIDQVSQLGGLIKSKVTLWGVPADRNGPGSEGTFGPPYESFGGRGAGPRVPFMTNGAECGVARSTKLSVASWDDPDTWLSYDSEPKTLTGCEKLRFEPELDMRPDSTRAGVPAGFAVDVAVPQSDNPEGLATPPVKDVTVTLPEGVTVSPSAADGLQGCTDQQVGLGSRGKPACPVGSRIGSVSVDTPLLAKPLTGSVFVGQPKSNDSQTGEMFRLFLVVQGAGVDVKLEGRVTPDPRTGQLKTVFLNNPQLPFDLMKLRFQGGPRAPLTNPQQCGSYTTNATISSWGGQVVESASTFVIDRDAAGNPCKPLGFSPAFDAGTVNPAGGKPSAFSLTLSRDDTQQDLRDVAVSMPEGLTGVIANVERCPEQAAAAGTCAASSRIGSVTVGAGAGTNPFYLSNNGVYLTTGYKGAPFGLSIVVPAIAGPFDLGVVVVRAAIDVDPTTAAVTVRADSMPTILQGVPLRVRTVNVSIDKPGFMLNPTDCTAKQIRATILSAQGTPAEVASRFQAANCAALPFSPRLSLALTGKKQRTTGKHPGVKAVVRQSGIGEAGIDRAKVTLPKAVALDPDNAQALCEYADGTKPDLENHCPKGSIVGRARAKTPLLDRELVGNVYFVKNVRRDAKTGNEIRTLPMIVVALRGEIAVNLTGKSSTAKDGRLVNTFASVPDAPITRFNLNIKGGSNGILAVTRTREARINLCAKPKSHTAQNEMDGQNGKNADYRVRVKTPCAKKAAKKG